MVSQYEEHGHSPCLLTWTVHTLWSCQGVSQFGTETKWTTGLNGSQFLIFSHEIVIVCMCCVYVWKKEMERRNKPISYTESQKPCLSKNQFYYTKKPKTYIHIIYILWISTNVLQELNAVTSFCDHCCDDLEGVNWIEVSYFELGVRDFGASNQIEINHHKKVY